MSFIESLKSRVTKLLRSGQDVVVTLDAPNTQLAVAYVGTVRLSFNGEKKAVITLAPGKHALAWGLEGQPGAEYKIEILSPEGSKWKPTKTPTIDSDGKAGGVHQFTVHPKV